MDEVFFPSSTNWLIFVCRRNEFYGNGFVVWIELDIRAIICKLNEMEENETNSRACDKSVTKYAQNNSLSCRRLPNFYWIELTTKL